MNHLGGFNQKLDFLSGIRKFFVKLCRRAAYIKAIYWSFWWVFTAHIQHLWQLQ